MESPSLDRTASSQPQPGCVAATDIIWGCSTGILAIDLLLTTDAQSGMLTAMAIGAGSEYDDALAMSRKNRSSQDSSI